jgi:hypothetical protein|tara:strand:+ start:1232 stop:1423 length:192 start_codon:yes stop_codon:yes gene_type:complete
LIKPTNLEAVLDGAENIIVITEKDGEVRLSFNQELDEMEVLDILALVTSKFYEIADDGNSSIH